MEILTGRIVKGVAGVYDVAVPPDGRYSCLARGLFRKHGSTPIPGDMVTITKLDREKQTGYLHSILPRKNELVRPRAANIDQALLVFAAKSPDINRLVVDSMLAYMENAGVLPVLCINKLDLASPGFVQGLVSVYSGAGYKVLPVSAAMHTGLDAVSECLQNRATILAGPSGVGKSSLINAVFPELSLETGELSKKIARGKNTTRRCELFQISPDSFIADSPGFTSFDAIDFPPEKLQYCFPEFDPFLGKCFYGDCLHLSEHDCAVKNQIGASISQERYDSYSALMSRE